MIALLMESSAIKQYWPKFNRAQKRRTPSFGIFPYEDRAGIMHLGYGPLRQLREPLITFATSTECRNFLTQLCTTFSLCPKYCQLRPSKGHCTPSVISGCEGICHGEETPADYNAKVSEVISFLNSSRENAIIEQTGRTAQEKGFVLIQDGSYKGYGFVDTEVAIPGIEDLEAYLMPQKNTLEARQIIASYC